MKRPIVIAMATLALTACSPRLSGVYKGTGNAIFEKIEFLSGGKADVSIFGTIREGKYEVDGKRVVISLNGQNQVFEIDDKGCLDGGRLVGTYCHA
ncbi:MAG: membrane lipoprotein lipid attachment site-containing protein [Alphaproteobacteria bacterium]|jgi:hypothetical protein|nr:membrane lipoprotein lipid attachment site-containing protein [Alphaproteobacteria bacterium]MBN9566901.1 membrane lipoprotein lipid attachment site-containing protein [Alphaproteobacteria bacterium]MBN9577946.1 membrane lipoprotein lipid attachment site-containing protein [Alphaproteobacteria bacterium]